MVENCFIIVNNETMGSPSKILIKRRKISSSESSGPPSTLLNGELAFNEKDKVLYYGFDEVAGNQEYKNAANIISIGGSHTNILKDSRIETINTTVTPTNEYLIIKVNDVEKAIRLHDF